MTLVRRTLLLYSLRTRMTVGFTAGFALLIFLTGLLVMFWRYSDARNNVANRLRAASHVAEQLGNKPVMTVTDWERVFEDIHEDQLLAIVAMQVRDNDGIARFESRVPAPRWADGQTNWVTLTHKVGLQEVTLGADWRVTELQMRRQLQLLSLSGLVAVFGAGVFAWILVGRTLHPIQALAVQASSAAADSAGMRLAPPSRDAEMLLLVNTLNSMLERLSENTRGKEQFYAAAAHELRTPLAVLSGNIELALARPRPAEEYVATLEDLQEQTYRLTRLAEDLLTLNRLSVGTEEEPDERVDVSDLCDRFLAALQPVVRGRQLTLTADLPEFSLDVPSMHLSLLLRNLLENAVKYATTGGRVEVRLHQRADAVEFSVYNDFSNATLLDYSKLFDPFYRADAARSATIRGNGLGLAISRRVADLHGWDLTVQAQSGGVIARLTLYADETIGISRFSSAELNVPLAARNTPQRSDI